MGRRRDPRKNLPPSLISPGDGGVLLSLSVPLMGKSSRRSGMVGKGHSPDMALTTAMCFPRTGATPGETCTMDVGFMPGVNVPTDEFEPG